MPSSSCLQKILKFSMYCGNIQYFCHIFLRCIQSLIWVFCIMGCIFVLIYYQLPVCGNNMNCSYFLWKAGKSQVSSCSQLFSDCSFVASIGHLKKGMCGCIMCFSSSVYFFLQVVRGILLPVPLYIVFMPLNTTCYY